MSEPGKDSPLDPMLTYEDVSRILRFDLRTVERYVDARLIGHAKFRRAVRFTRPEVSEFILRHTVRPRLIGPAQIVRLNDEQMQELWERFERLAETHRALRE